MDRFREETLLWAKSDPFKGLWQHLRETAIVAGRLLNTAGYAAALCWMSVNLGVSCEELVCLVMYLAGMHDIGKCHPCFADNACCASASRVFELHHELRYPAPVENYRHERGSRSAAKRIWKEQKTFGTHAIRDFADVLGLHHQGRNGIDVKLCRNDPDFPEGDRWIGWQDQLEHRLRDWLRPPYIDNQKFKERDAISMTLLGLIILSDWIASGEIFAETSEEMTDKELGDRADQFIRKTGMSESTLMTHRTFRDLWPFMSDASLRPLQSALQNYMEEKTEQPLVMILEAPMGEGKTEAGIYAAMHMAQYWHKQGMYVGLPTSATANQMLTRVRDLLDQHGLGTARLVHGTAWLYEDSNLHIESDEDRRQAQSWFCSSKRQLLMPAGVGTVDQVMMSVLHIRYGVLRLIGLENKVLIIDEIHSYDAYMSDIIVRLLAWCRALRIPVVMLSATLPESRKRELLKAYSREELRLQKGYPMITAVYQDGALEQVPVTGSYQKNQVQLLVEESLGDEAKIAGTAMEWIQVGGCLCVLVNTVREAQYVYRELQEKVDSDTDLMLFHARFTAGRRKQIEEECIRKFGKKTEARPKKAILVATQVVEQSLDVDFDAMITEIAPVDLILQRIGRVHRHQETPRPEHLRVPRVQVLVPAGGNYGSTQKIYFRILLDRTQRLLRATDVVHIPEDIPAMVEEVYRQEPDPGEMAEFEARLFKDQLMQGSAQSYELRGPGKTFSLPDGGAVFGDDSDSWVSARTRMSSPTERIAVLPAELFELAGGEEDLELDREIMMCSISASAFPLRDAIAEMDEERKKDGSRRLTGITLLCADQRPGDACSTLTCAARDYQITVDRMLGFTIEKTEGK